MDVVTSVSEMRRLAQTLRTNGKRIALVPTMGALHRGHLSLVERAKELADTTVISIFVNPTQFGPNEDFTTYPRPFEDDCRRAEAAGGDVVFAPSAGEMYPPRHATTVTVSGITGQLCGRSRPTHFQGVTTVVMKLLNIVQPHCAVFGAKDAQLVRVIRRMVEDLHLPVDIIVGAIVRETDGLAMSSRNVYLTPEERTDAPLINSGLMAVERAYGAGERSSGVLIENLRQVYAQSSLIEPDYCEIVDLQSLEPVHHITDPVLFAVACRMRMSGTRLIDNTVLGGSL